MPGPPPATRAFASASTTRPIISDKPFTVPALKPLREATQVALPLEETAVVEKEDLRLTGADPAGVAGAGPPGWHSTPMPTYGSRLNMAETELAVYRAEFKMQWSSTLPGSPLTPLRTATTLQRRVLLQARYPQ